MCGPLVGWVERIGTDHHFVILDFEVTGIEGVLVAGDDADDARWVPVSAIGELPLVDGLERFFVEHGCRGLRSATVPRVAQRPCQFGARFSTNAARPSFRSSEPMTRPSPRSSSSSASRRPRSRTRARSCGSPVPPSARTGRSARRGRSQCRATARARTDRFTRPRSCARCADSGSPVRMTSIAAARPIARGRRKSPPAPAIEVALDLREPERRSRRCDHEVACQHDLASARCRESVDGGDHGLRAFAIGEAGEAALLRRDAAARGGVDGFEVGAGAEHRPITDERRRDHAHPDIRDLPRSDRLPLPCRRRPHRSPRCVPQGGSA